MVGKVEMLKVRSGLHHWKHKSIDLSRVLFWNEEIEGVGQFKQQEQDHEIDSVLDRKLIHRLKSGVQAPQFEIINTDRATGAMLSNYWVAKNIIIGNVAFYGATSGESYIAGRAGERFCVRNSGANVVVEGIGDNGCEYMTGGTALIIGEIGKNFAAGMSGGLAYVLDPNKLMPAKTNMAGISLESLDESDLETVKYMLDMHVVRTSSAKAKDLLADWDNVKTQFTKVFPLEYKRALEQQANAAQLAKTA